MQSEHLMVFSAVWWSLKKIPMVHCTVFRSRSFPAFSFHEVSRWKFGKCSVCGEILTGLRGLSEHNDFNEFVIYIYIYLKHALPIRCPLMVEVLTFFFTNIFLFCFHFYVIYKKFYLGNFTYCVAVLLTKNNFISLSRDFCVGTSTAVW